MKITTVSKHCHKCNHSFRVLEDEQFDHGFPHCGSAEDESYGDDVMGDEVKKGDYYLEHNGEIILETNVIDYLVDYLGAIRKTAGKDE
jgi:hypothetical protein